MGVGLIKRNSSPIHLLYIIRAVATRNGQDKRGRNGLRFDRILGPRLQCGPHGKAEECQVSGEGEGGPRDEGIVVLHPRHVC